MRLLPFILLMFVCIVAGTRVPVFFLGAYLLFVWLAVALFARAVRWLIRASGIAPVGANGGCCPGGTRANAHPSGLFQSEGNRSPILKRMGYPAAQADGRVKVCPDDRCGRVNIGPARYCAQCGRRLA